MNSKLWDKNVQFWVYILPLREKKISEFWDINNELWENKSELWEQKLQETFYPVAETSFNYI